MTRIRLLLVIALVQGFLCATAVITLGRLQEESTAVVKLLYAIRTWLPEYVLNSVEERVDVVLHDLDNYTNKIKNDTELIKNLTQTREYLMEFGESARKAVVKTSYFLFQYLSQNVKIYEKIQESWKLIFDINGDFEDFYMETAIGFNRTFKIAKNCSMSAIYNPGYNHSEKIVNCAKNLGKKIMKKPPGLQRILNFADKVAKEVGKKTMDCVTRKGHCFHGIHHLIKKRIKILESEMKLSLIPENPVVIALKDEFDNCTKSVVKAFDYFAKELPKTCFVRRDQ